MSKLRFATYYESTLGRNDGNPLYITNALRNRESKGELTIDHLAPRGDLSLYGTYDAHFWIDWGEDGLGGILPYKPDFPANAHPLVYWASDTHLGYDYRLSMAKKADIVFCAQKRAVEEFKRDGVQSTWLPHAFEPQAYPALQYAEKKYDVCFVGHINSGNRVLALDHLFKAFPNFYYGQKRFEEAASIYSQSKICFNISMKDDLNMRTFEVMGSGNFLLTNWIPTIEDLFEDGKHLALYRSHEEMIDKAKFYLDHPDLREAIAKAGHEEVMSRHKIDDRLDVMLGKIKEMHYANH